MVNDWTAVAVLYVLFPSAVAVIVHFPAPVVVPVAVVALVELTLHGPPVAKVNPSPEEEDALTENPLPYVTPGNGAKLMVCDCPLEPGGWIMKDPDAGLAAS
jgi:hypothetical protein